MEEKLKVIPVAACLEFGSPRASERINMRIRYARHIAPLRGIRRAVRVAHDTEEGVRFEPVRVLCEERCELGGLQLSCTRNSVTRHEA